MSLPGVTPPIDKRSFMSLDDMITELNIPRQEFEIAQSTEPRQPVPLPGDRSKIDPEAGEKFSAETTRKAGEQIAELIVSGTGGLCSFIGSEKATKYRPSRNEENDLAKVWANVAAFYGWQETNPLLQAAIVTGAIVIPPVRDAFKDRQIKKLQEEQKRLEEEQKRLALEMIQMREQMTKDRLHNGTTDKSEPAAA